jgi:hypothetical protein
MIRKWPILFVIFGLYGSLGEIFIGTIFTLLGRTLWLYYNGFYTSIEAFLLFGLFGCIGFKLYKIYEERWIRKGYWMNAYKAIKLLKEIWEYLDDLLEFRKNIEEIQEWIKSVNT